MAGCLIRRLRCTTLYCIAIAATTVTAAAIATSFTTAAPATAALATTLATALATADLVANSLRLLRLRRARVPRLPPRRRQRSSRRRVRAARARRRQQHCPYLYVCSRQLVHGPLQKYPAKSIEELRELRDGAQRRLLHSKLPTPPPFETYSAPLVVGFAPNSSAPDFPHGWAGRVLNRAVSGKLWGKMEGQTKRSAGSGGSAGASQFR